MRRPEGVVQVEIVSKANECHTNHFQFRQRIHKMLQGAPEAINLPGQHRIKPALTSVECEGGTRCVLEWKTTSSRYPEQPEGLLALDPQLVCCSWMTGISEVAQVVFVRKRLVEVQYLHTSIPEEQRQEFSQLVAETIERIERAQFLPHSGIRFPQNPCSSCPYIGLCLGRTDLVESALVRRAGAEHLDWINELAD